MGHIDMVADTFVETFQHYSISPPLGIKIGDHVIQGARQITNILKTMYPIPAPMKPITSTPPPSIIKKTFFLVKDRKKNFASNTLNTTRRQLTSMISLRQYQSHKVLRLHHFRG